MKNPVTVAFTVALPFLLSCRSQMHTLRSTSHTDTVMTVSIHRDSIYVRDSTVT